MRGVHQRSQQCTSPFVFVAVGKKLPPRDGPTDARPSASCLAHK